MSTRVSAVQDRYAGDIGDFMKFGLLRALADESGLRLGVNWYLTGDESHNADGKHVTYLDPANSFHASLKRRDPDLMARLAGVVAAGRSVSALEAAGVLPTGTVTYPARLDDRMWEPGRARWHQGALDSLAGAQVVFVDPDNGIRSVRNGPTPSKFVFPDELADYTGRGQSLIVYHHADRSPGGVAIQVPRRLNELADATGVDPLGAVIARRASVRYFFVVPAAAHRDRLAQALGTYVDLWAAHTEYVAFAGP